MYYKITLISIIKFETKERDPICQKDKEDENYICLETTNQSLYKEKNVITFICSLKAKIKKNLPPVEIAMQEWSTAKNKFHRARYNRQPTQLRTTDYAIAIFEVCNHLKTTNSQQRIIQSSICIGRSKNLEFRAPNELHSAGAKLGNSFAFDHVCTYVTKDVSGELDEFNG